MGRLRRNACVALAAAAIAGLGVKAHAAEPSYDELKQEVDQLKTRLDQVESKQAEAVSAKDVDATVDRVIKDAEQRSQLLQMEGFTAGYTKGRFTIQDAAGNWVLRPTFQFQVRNSSNWREDGKHGGNDSDSNYGFEIPRMKIGFDGNAINPNLSYYFLWNTSSTSGSLGLEQAWVRYQWNDQFASRSGQFINPVFREQAIGSRTQLAVDRSLVNGLITGVGEARTQATEIIYDDKNAILAEAGLEDGFNSQNTDYTDPNVTPTSNDWGIFGRFNYFVKGPRSEAYQFSALADKDDLLLIGGGGDVTQTGDTTSYLHTVDVQWENTMGLGVYAAYLGDYIDNGGAGSNSFYNWGFLVQAGYMLNQNWEVFGRYDFTKLDSDAVGPGIGDEYCEITLGLNWYIFGGHNAKVTVDATWLPNGSPANVGGSDILASQDNEIIVREQFQLLL